MSPLTTAYALISVGAVCLLAAVRLFVRQRRILEIVPFSNTPVQLPTQWDDGEITRLLQRHHDQPAVLSHVVSSIKTRLVLNQDLKTAQRRLALMASVIEVFKLNKEMQGILHDIHLDEKNFEINKVEAQMRLEDADAKLKSERVLRDLRKQREELQLNKEISQLRQDIKVVERPADAQPKLSPEQERANRHAASEARLVNLKEEKQKALKLDDEQERVLKVNALDDEIQKEMATWSKTLP